MVNMGNIPADIGMIDAYKDKLNNSLGFLSLVLSIPSVS